MGLKRKVIISLIILFILIFINETISFARYQPEQFGLIITDDAGGTEEIKNFGADILGIVRVVGTLASVGIAMVLGIKYMLGSTEARAEYKRTMLPYVLGAVILFSGVNITQFIYDFVHEENAKQIRNHSHVVSDKCMFYGDKIAMIAYNFPNITMEEADQKLKQEEWNNEHLIAGITPGLTKEKLLDAIWVANYFIQNEIPNTLPMETLETMKKWLKDWYNIDSDKVNFSGEVEIKLVPENKEVLIPEMI